MNAFLVAVLATAVVAVSARSPLTNQQLLSQENSLEGRTAGLSGRILNPEDTLKTLLSVPTGSGSIGGGSSSDATGKLVYNLNHDFVKRVNPRNPTSDWKWLSDKQGKYAADNGIFIRDGISMVELAALPFTKSAEDQSRVSILTGYEAVLVNKGKFVVEPEHKLTVRAVFSVKVKNVEDQPFGRQAVANVTDDPSLASAGISLASSGKGGLVFSIVATNNGIWAVYERNRLSIVNNPQSDDKIFTIFHRLADRESACEEIDAAITYVRSQNLVHYKLNNVVVYTIKNLGLLPNNEPDTLYHTTSRSDLVPVEPKEFSVSIGLMNWLDAQDPNNPAHSYSNQRLTSEDVYDRKYKFVDETGNKMYNSWGQGAILKLHDIQIKLEKATEKDDNNKNVSVRNGKTVGEETDGKLIVADPTVDLSVLAEITGERVPRSNVQGGDEESSVAANEEESVAAQDGDSEEPVRTGRKAVQPEEESLRGREQPRGGKAPRRKQ